MKDKFSKLKGKMNNKVALSAIGIFVSLLLIVGFSYAIVIFTGDSGLNSIKSGKISMSYTESSNVINITNALPMTDTDGKNQTNYFDFSITSKADTNSDDAVGIKIPYDLIIEPKTVDSDKIALTGEQIKVYLTRIENGVESKVLEPVKLSDLNLINTNYKLYSTKNIHKNGNGAITTKYRLRAWIDYGVDASDFNTKTYQYKFAVNVNSTANNGGVNLDKSGANKPLLTDNMVPVYYDDTDKVWRVADQTNTDADHKWYDYDNKQYANVVTLNNAKYFKSAENKEFVTTNNRVSLSEEVLSYKEVKESERSLSMVDYHFSCGDSYTFDDKTGKFSITNPVDVYPENLVPPKYCEHFETNGDYILHMTGSCSFASEYDYSNLTCYGSSISAKGDTFTEKYGSTSYTFDDSTGVYKLTNPTKIPYTKDYIDYYTCDSETKTECKTMYKLKEVNDYGNVFTADVYDAGITINDYENNLTPGMTISNDDIDTMWVWIPRYKYTYFKSSTSVEIPITFEKGTASTGTIKCTDAISTTSNKSETCTDTTNGDLVVGTSTYTHPAFNFGDEKLTGLWISKYGASKNKMRIAPDLALRSSNLSSYFKLSREMEGPNNEYGFPQSGTSLNTVTGEITGDSNKFDIHPIKNMEYGAMLYFSHSKHGNCVGGTCSNVTESSNGNIYGIYNLSSITMGNMVNKSGEFNVGNAGTWSETSTPLAKYYDRYSYGTTTKDATAFGRSKLGDGISEVYVSEDKLWYSSSSNYMPYAYVSGSYTSYHPWFERNGFVLKYNSSSGYNHPVITITE